MNLSGGAILSVVVCTSDGADLVTPAIESLLTQTLDPGLYEVIVVENGSRGRTESITAELASPPHRLRYVFEPRHGLAVARNRGWEIATTPYVGYIDDDARADRRALERAVSFLSESEDIRCVGGPIAPIYAAPKPSWFKDEYEARTWGRSGRYLRRGESFSGSNMFWRRSTLEEFGGFRPELGAKGQRLALGEEARLFRSIWEKERDARFWYSPELVVYHLVPVTKLSPRYALKRALATGEYVVRSGAPRQTPAAARAGMYAYRFVVGLARGLARMRRHRYWQRWVYEEVAPAFIAAGALLVSLGVRFHFHRRGEALPPG